MRIQGVTYSYPGQTSPALQGMSLALTPGEVLAVMGPTGSGKTTLLSLLNGLIPQFYEGNFSGQVWTDGSSTRETRIQDYAGRVGLTMQDAETQIFGGTVFEDVTYGPRNLGLPREKIFEEAAAALEQVRLLGFEDRQTVDLSGGEAQRLAIAGILAMRPRILALDEPTSELDPLGREEIIAAVQALRSQGQTTILLVSHQADEALRLADRVAVVRGGQIVWLGPPRRLFRSAVLVHDFSLKPPQTAELGEDLRRKGLISAADVPLTVDEAEILVRKLMSGPNFIQPEHEKDFAVGAETKPDNRPVLIEVDQLTHDYPGGVHALKGISLTVREGDLLAVIGHNGAGKSTLVKHFNALLHPSQGSVKVNGVDTRRSTTTDLARQVGYVFQNPDHQIFCNTVEEEMRFGLKNLGIAAAEQDRRIAEALDCVGLADQRQRHPFSLGKGERQKVAVASVLAIAPPVICIDEPTTGLDWLGVQRMMDLVAELNRKGHTIILITHDMELVASYTRRVLLLKQGRLAMDGAPADVFLHTGLLQECFLSAPPVCQLAQRLGDLGCPGSIHTVWQMSDAIVKALEGEIRDG